MYMIDYKNILFKNIKYKDMINNIGHDFYHDNLRKVMNDSRFKPNKRYEIAIDILDTYMSIREDIIRFEDRMLRSNNIFTFDHTEVIKDMMNMNNDLTKYIVDKKSYLESFDIDKYITEDICEVNDIEEYPDTDDEEQLKVFKDLLEYIDKFKNYQFELIDSDKYYLHQKYIDEPDIIYNDVLENLIDKHMKRIYYVEVEMMKIKYANRIGIRYPLVYVKEYICNYIYKCKKDDNISSISKKNNKWAETYLIT